MRSSRLDFQEDGADAGPVGGLGLIAVLIAGPAQGPAPDAPAARTSTIAEQRLVDMVVAVVDGSVVITYSELVSEATLLLLQTRGPQWALKAQLSRDLLRSVLRNRVDRELILRETDRLQMRAVDRSRVNELLRTLKRSFDDEAGWQRFLVLAGFRDPGDPTRAPPPELLAVLRAQAQAEAFLEVRVTRSIVVSDDDVAACYAARAQVFRGASLTRVAPRIRKQLEVQRHSQAMISLIEQLEDRARIRYDPEFEPPERSRDPEPPRAAGSSFTCPQNIARQIDREN